MIKGPKLRAESDLVVGKVTGGTYCTG